VGWAQCLSGSGDYHRVDGKLRLDFVRIDGAISALPRRIRSRGFLIVKNTIYKGVVIA